MCDVKCRIISCQGENAGDGCGGDGSDGYGGDGGDWGAGCAGFVALSVVEAT